MNNSLGKKYFWTPEVIERVKEVYQTATSHQEAAIMIDKKYGIKTKSKTLEVIVSREKIERPFISHGGDRRSGKKYKKEIEE